MHQVSLFGLVQETLQEKWSAKFPSHINSDDLTAGIALFANITAKSISSSMDREISSEVDAPTADKIKKFVRENGCFFYETCETGFPFSLLGGPAAENSLEEALVYKHILFHFLMSQDHWMSENELNECFEDPFQRLEIHEIIRSCSKLGQAYLEDRDKKAGYYLLWLIKKYTGCDYTIPERDAFHVETAASVLARFLNNSGPPKDPINFVKILYSKVDRGNHFYQIFFNHPSLSIFLSLVAAQLQRVPIDQWPEKIGIIGEFLKTHPDKLLFAEELALSTDPITADIGFHTAAILKASNLNEVIPHFYALEKLLPNLNKRLFRCIFGYSFMRSFIEESAILNGCSQIKKVIFNDKRFIDVQDSLMIGMYDTSELYRGLSSQLLAYDMSNGKMVWGGFLPKHACDCNLLRAGEYICLHLKREKRLDFIHPKTGELAFTVELPEVFSVTDAGHRDFHISSQGFTYQLARKENKRFLIGGKVIDERWIPSFEINAPKGFFQPLSTHCGFYDSKEPLTLYGPTGDQITIPKCVDVRAYGDKLYTIEKDLSENRYLLNIRTLKMDPEVASQVETSIPLNGKYYSFGGLCEKELLILFEHRLNRASEKWPIFINLNTQEVLFNQHEIPVDAFWFIDRESGELWTWQGHFGEIWKVSPTKATLIGRQERQGPGTKLIHVDKEDHLYFARDLYG